MTTTYTLTGDFADILGVDLPGNKIQVTVDTNLGSVALVDLDSNTVRPPRPSRVSVAADGTFSVDLIATNSTGTNITDDSLRYIVRATYSDGHGRNLSWDSGYFELTANADLSDVIGTAFLPPTFASEALAQMQAMLDEAGVITGLTGEDDAVAALLASPTSDTYAASDAATAAQIGDAGSAVAVALDGKIETGAEDAIAANVGVTVAPAARARLGSRWVFEGDSITIGSISTDLSGQTRSGSWTVDMAYRSGGRIDYVHCGAVAGTGIAQALARFATNVEPYAPDVVCLSIGTNDLAVGTTLAAYLDGLEDYYALVRGIGAQLVLGGIYPKSTSQATVAAWNDALLEWATARDVILIPFWQLGDPATGAWPTGWTSDGVHPLRESAAFPALGALAWNTVKYACGGPVAPTAKYVGEGIYTDFFTTLTTAMTGHATFSGAATIGGGGTLADGTYEYRVAARNRYGKEASYSDQTAVVSGQGGAGKVTLSVGGSGTYNYRMVYRKAPGDTAFKYLGMVTTLGTAQPFVDDGTVAPTYQWVDGDTSRVPTGLLNGSTTDGRTLAYGGPIQTDAAVRGNVLRLARLEGSGALHADHFTVTGLTAGQEVVVTCKVRGANTAAATERLILQFRPPDDASTLAQGTAFYHRLGTDWVDVFARFTVPTGSDRVRLSFQGDATSPYVDVAELRLALA